MTFTEVDSNLRHVETSQTLLLNEQSRLMEDSGRDIFKFGFGQSPFPPVSSAIEALKQAAGRKDYMPVQGLPDLRERVASFHREAEGLNATEDRILIAPGSKSLLFTVMAAFQSANILIPAPAWVSYAPQAALLGHPAVRVHATFEQRWRVTPEALDRAFNERIHKTAPALLILNYPGNPDGLSYTREELQGLTEVCRRHHILVMSDEIYGLIHHTGNHVPLATIYPEGTVTTGGLSKWCGAGGWRLGMALLPEGWSSSLKEVMLGIASETYSCASAPVQIAACSAYRWSEEVQTYLAHQRALLRFIGNWSAQQLQQAGLRVHAPQGGFYLFVDARPLAEVFAASGIHSSQDMCSRLLADTGVALLPGEAFGMAPHALCARLAYVEFDGAAALSHMRSLAPGQALGPDALSTLFAKTERGIIALSEWAQRFSSSSVANLHAA